MTITEPIPFWEAIQALARQNLMPTELGSDELSQLARDVRRDSFFSAKVINAGFLQRAHDLITAIIEPRYAGGKPGTYIDRSRARELLKNYLQSIGYAPEPGKEGSLQDLQSDARLNLILDTNIQMAQGFGQFLQANSAADAFPAQELYRLESRIKPRDWPRKWHNAGGKFYGGGRMIALLDDPIWIKTIDEGGFNRFGNPYPPYDFNSGMWTRPVSRGEAIELGVIAPDDQVVPHRLVYGDRRAIDVRNLTESLASALLQTIGNAEIIGGVLRIIGGAK